MVTDDCIDVHGGETQAKDYYTFCISCHRSIDVLQCSCHLVRVDGMKVICIS